MSDACDVCGEEAGTETESFYNKRTRQQESVSCCANCGDVKAVSV